MEWLTLWTRSRVFLGDVKDLLCEWLTFCVTIWRMWVLGCNRPGCFKIIYHFTCFDYFSHRQGSLRKYQTLFAMKNIMLIYGVSLARRSYFKTMISLINWFWLSEKKSCSAWEWTFRAAGQLQRSHDGAHYTASSCLALFHRSVFNWNAWTTGTLDELEHTLGPWI